MRELQSFRIVEDREKEKKRKEKKKADSSRILLQGRDPKAFNVAKMNWNVQMDSHYTGNVSQYNGSGSFIDFFAGLTYDHVNFIFAGSSPMQDSAYSSVGVGYYKYGYSEPGVTQYYSNSQAYEAYDHIVGIDEYSRRPSAFASTNTGEQTTATNEQSERMSNTNVNMRSRDCPRSHHNSHDNQELLELGETVRTQRRGLSQEQISLLPVSKFKFRFFSRKKSRCERCVICQMEYKRGDRQITLPCKHKYHVCCGTKWLGINKACPICYTEVSIGTNKK